MLEKKSNIPSPNQSELMLTSGETAWNFRIQGSTQRDHVPYEEVPRKNKLRVYTRRDYMLILFQSTHHSGFTKAGLELSVQPRMTLKF